MSNSGLWPEDNIISSFPHLIKRKKHFTKDITLFSLLNFLIYIFVMNVMCTVPFNLTPSGYVVRVAVY